MNERTNKLALWAAGILLAIPLAGIIGYHNGFAKIIQVTELQQSLPHTIADGIKMLWHSPLNMFEAGLHDTISWFWLIGLLLAGGAVLSIVLFGSDETSSPSLPAASATDTRNIKPRSIIYEIISSLGAVLCIIVTLALFAWLVMRDGVLLDTPMPWDSQAVSGWLINTKIAAGLDVIALAASVVWFLFALHLNVQKWLKILTLSAAGLTLVATFTGWSLSNGIAEQAQINRAIVQIKTDNRIAEIIINTDDTATVSSDENVNPETEITNNENPETVVPQVNEYEYFMLGYTTTHLVLVSQTGEVQFVTPTINMTIVNRTSLVKFISATTQP